MGATVFVQPLDLVKNRMQLSGQGTKAREYKTSFHALFSILKNEGVRGIYTGYVTQAPLHVAPHLTQQMDAVFYFPFQFVSRFAASGDLHHNSSGNLHHPVREDDWSRRPAAQLHSQGTRLDFSRRHCPHSAA